jgi:uncharacterized protein (TIGR02466 family)
MSNDYQFLFPSVIHYFNVKDYNKIKKKLIKFAYNERKGDRNGVIISNIGGWQSKSTYASSDNLLQQTILESVSSYFSNRDIFNTGKNLAIDDLWININNKGDSNIGHIHPDSHFSGVLWISIPENSGKLEFESPHHFSRYNEVDNYSEEFKHYINSYNSYWFPPKEGMIIMFSSALRHEVKSNDSNKDRISAAFNITLK